MRMVAVRTASIYSAGMSRRWVALLACLLLLGLQEEGLLHGVDHLREQVAQAHERAITHPGTACDECALLAGAAHALASTLPALAAPSGHHLSPGASPASVRIAAPRYYAARAPPQRA